MSSSSNKQQKLHAVVSEEEWIKARQALLEKEKEFNRLRDELSQQRRDLPWRKIDKTYTFQKFAQNGENVEELTLKDLFGDKSQLIVQHFMFGPDWKEGCKSCSFMADSINPNVAHLAARDTSLVVVSRAPVATIEAFRQRMKWTLPWVSSVCDPSFNFDFQASFTPEQIQEKKVYYNYRMGPFHVTEAPGISVFFKDKEGNIFHTYSTYARGLDTFINAYHLLDIVPKGRDEADLGYSMEWVKHHDRYDDDEKKD